MFIHNPINNGKIILIPWNIKKFKKDGNTLWAATSGGILKTDLLTGKQRVFTRASANLPSAIVIQTSDNRRSILS